jgi:hypothetical protein
MAPSPTCVVGAAWLQLPRHLEALHTKPCDVEFLDLESQNARPPDSQRANCERANCARAR